ncbi:osmoprotectant transport system substrate-binding protein [Enterococcus lemanii]|nr:glycine betaine ABC transporter substrate-binding protein [Enterococcus lemanii]MBM7710268.1 osmoprotectant transport system substrate-binding protein [Enterococcus lemanii]NLM66752.1 glycine/betaine ABC transporter substrate-binding protein [Enterococcus sp.]
MKKIIMSGLMVLFAVALVACSGTSGNNEATKETVKVGSKDFTENLVISEIYALALEDKGYKVERVQNIAGSIIPKSIESGEIDLYPEYTGTALLSIFKLPLETDPDAVFTAVKKAYEEAGVLTVLDYAPGNDGQGIAINTSMAQKYDIVTISDLQANADKIRFASQGEFDERADGLKGLAEVYGPFDFISSTVYDNSLKYQVLTSDEADATPAYTTEGPLSDKAAFTVLVDDKQFWPPYNLMPVVRQDLLKAHPEIAEIINQIDQAIDTDTLIQLNAKVDIDGEDYTKVAKAYYESLE